MEGACGRGGEATDVALSRLCIDLCSCWFLHIECQSNTDRVRISLSQLGRQKMAGSEAVRR